MKANYVSLCSFSCSINKPHSHHFHCWMFESVEDTVPIISLSHGCRFLFTRTSMHICVSMVMWTMSWNSWWNCWDWTFQSGRGQPSVKAPQTTQHLTLMWNHRLLQKKKWWGRRGKDWLNPKMKKWRRGKGHVQWRRREQTHPRKQRKTKGLWFTLTLGLLMAKPPWPGPLQAFRQPDSPPTHANMQASTSPTLLILSHWCLPHTHTHTHTHTDQSSRPATMKVLQPNWRKDYWWNPPERPTSQRYMTWIITGLTLIQAGGRCPKFLHHWNPEQSHKAQILVDHGMKLWLMLRTEFESFTSKNQDGVLRRLL